MNCFINHPHIDFDHIYSYEEFLECISCFGKFYAELIHIKSIGKTYCNREIPMLILGKGKKILLFTAGVHGRTVNVVTLVILALYVGGVRYLANEDGEECDDCEKSGLSIRQIVVRFVLTSIAIVALSITMTYITDDIASTYNIGVGLAGAIFLGVATSLPEVSSTIALFRMRNYNVAVGNIVGSNLFNFLVLCVADVLCFSQSIYDYSDNKVVGLLQSGLLATLFVIVMLCGRKSWIKVIAGLVVVALYMAFLLR